MDETDAVALLRETMRGYRPGDTHAELFELAELASVRVDGLHVYFFGRRKPLSVGELLFYWQD